MSVLGEVDAKVLQGEESAGLTEAELDILGRLLAGRSNAEIAGERTSSKSTVANQIATLFKKLGVKSRRELVARVRGVALQDPTQANTLTSRERRVLLLASRGWSDKAIASDLECTTSAVGALLTRTRRKLNRLLVDNAGRTWKSLAPSLLVGRGK